MGKDHSRPFDRSYTTYYWSAIVSIALYCTIFDVKQYCDLEIWVKGHSMLLKIIPFDIRISGYGFLSVFYSNYGHIYSHF